jgi:hypothetical protein
LLGHKNIGGQLTAIYSKNRYRKEHAEALQRLVVDQAVEIVDYDEVVEADVKAAQYLMSCRHPEKWSLNKMRGGGDSESADEIARQEAAVRQLLDDTEARSVAALIGLKKSSASGRRRALHSIFATSSDARIG